MNVITWLIVNRKGNVRVNKTGTGVQPHEIAMKVILNIPDSFFVRPQPVVKIDVPASLVADLTPEASVEITARAVAESLGVSVEDVKDGLTDVLNWSKEADAPEATP